MTKSASEAARPRFTVSKSTFVDLSTTDRTCVVNVTRPTPNHALTRARPRQKLGFNRPLPRRLIHISHDFTCLFQTCVFDTTTTTHMRLDYSIMFVLCFLAKSRCVCTKTCSLVVLCVPLAWYTPLASPCLEADRRNVTLTKLLLDQGLVSIQRMQTTEKVETPFSQNGNQNVTIKEQFVHKSINSV